MTQDVNEPIDLNAMRQPAQPAAPEPVKPVNDGKLVLGGVRYDLAPGIAFSRLAKLLKALQETDLEALTEHLPLAVVPDHREALKQALEADAEHGEKGFIDASEVFEQVGDAIGKLTDRS